MIGGPDDGQFGGPDMQEYGDPNMGQQQMNEEEYAEYE